MEGSIGRLVDASSTWNSRKWDLAACTDEDASTYTVEEVGFVLGGANLGKCWWLIMVMEGGGGAPFSYR